MILNKSSSSFWHCDWPNFTHTKTKRTVEKQLYHKQLYGYIFIHYVNSLRHCLSFKSHSIQHTQKHQTLSGYQNLGHVTNKLRHSGQAVHLQQERKPRATHFQQSKDTTWGLHGTSALWCEKKILKIVCGLSCNWNSSCKIIVVSHAVLWCFYCSAVICQTVL